MNSNRSKKANSIDPKWKHLIDIFSSQSNPSTDHYGLFTPQNPQNSSDFAGFQGMFIRKGGKASTLPFKHYPTHSYSGHLKVDTHYTRLDTFNSDNDNPSAQFKQSEIRTATTANSKSTRAHTLRSSKKEPESAGLKKEIRPKTSVSKKAELNRNNTISSYFQLETETIREGESLNSEDYDVSVAGSPLDVVNKSVSQADLARKFLTLNLSGSTKVKKDVMSRANNKSGGVSYKAVNMTAQQQQLKKDLKLSLDEEDYKRFLNQTADKEGSLDGTASPRQVKVYSRSKDTAFHFTKMKPVSTKSTSTCMNSYGLFPQNSKFFNSSMNDSSQNPQGFSFASRPGTAVHRRSRNSKFPTAKIEAGPNTTTEISQTKHKRPSTALNLGSDHIQRRLQTTSISPFLKIDDDSRENNKTAEIKILSHRSRGASPVLSIIKQETLDSHRSSRKSKVPPGGSERSSPTKIPTEKSAMLSPAKRAKAAVTKHLKMLDLVKNLEIRERLSPKSIDQTSLMNRSTKYNQRITDFITGETDQIQDEVQNILDNINMRLQAGQDIRSNKSKIFIEDEEENRFDENDVDENGIKNKRKILNDFDIKVITEEYDKIENGPGRCNYERVDALVNGLKFFQQLDKIMRLDLLKNGTLKHFPAGSTIFKQGDYGDLMYVILKGAVNVRIMKPTIWGTIEDVILAVLYDGAHFGEYSMMGTSQQNKRNEFKNNKRLDIGANLINVETGENNLIGTRKGLKEMAAQMNETPRNSGMREQDSEASPNQAEKSPNSQNPSNYKERSKRAATIQVVESCDLLCIPRSHFQKIFLKFLQKDLDAKIQILLCLPFFSKMDAYTLIPIANNLTQKIYKLGDVIINHGQNLDRFQIVSQGRCKTLLELSRKIETKTTVFTRGVPAAHKMFTVGEVDYTCIETATREERFVSKDKKRRTASNFPSTKSFDQEKLGTEGDAEIYREHETLKVLTRGDYFAGRALLSSEDINVYQDDYKKLSMISKPAQVSIVADSAVVEVFELHKDNFKYIPDFLAQILLKGLKSNQEFDEYNIPKQIDQAQKWHTFKNKEVYDILAKRTLDKPAYYKKF